ncbi:MAG: hypothetical protein ACC742_06020 [Thermoanaerobaculales bacterium]
MWDTENVLQAFSEAASDRSRGASEIEARLVDRLLAVEGSWSAETQGAGAALLADGQPVMAGLRSLAARAFESDPHDFRRWLQRRLQTLKELPQRLAANAWPFVESAERILTISRSAAVAAVVEGAWERGWQGSVVVLDGTEVGRGPDQARRLAAAGPSFSRPDAATPMFLDEAGVIIVVGADAVGPRRFLNILGTRMLFELADVRDIKRLVVADSSKNLLADAVDEVAALAPTHRDADGREWPVFELTPLHLVSVRISEEMC